MAGLMGHGLVRVRKFTIKVAVVYIVAVILFAFADSKPAEPYFWVGCGLVALGAWLRFWAAGHLVKNKQLTTTGPYSYVKNPLYIGTFLVTTGVCLLGKGDPTREWYFAHVNWFVLGIFVLVFLFYYVPYKRKREGDRLREIYGEDWDIYDKNVPDYFPRLTPYSHPKKADVRWTWAAACENSEQWTFLGILALVLAIAFQPTIMAFIGKFVK